MVVAPLERPHWATFADRLNPRVTIEGNDFVLITREIVTVRRSVLSSPRGSIVAARDPIIRALDLLLTGF